MYVFSFLHYRVKHVLFSFSPAAGFQISAGRTGMGRQPDRRRGELKKPVSRSLFLHLLFQLDLFSIHTYSSSTFSYSYV